MNTARKMGGSKAELDRRSEVRMKEPDEGLTELPLRIDTIKLPKNIENDLKNAVTKARLKYGGIFTNEEGQRLMFPDPQVDEDTINIAKSSAADFIAFVNSEFGENRGVRLVQTANSIELQTYKDETDDPAYDQGRRAL